MLSDTLYAGWNMAPQLTTLILMDDRKRECIVTGYAQSDITVISSIK